jgi:hypothetical protein
MRHPPAYAIMWRALHAPSDARATAATPPVPIRMSYDATIERSDDR